MKKLDKKKFFIINTSTFDTDIAIFINYSFDEVLKVKGNHLKELRELLQSWKDKNKDEEDFINSKSINGRMIPLDKGYAVFLKFYKDSFRLNMALAIHEITHVVAWLLNDRRIKLSLETDEVYAYLMEELCKKFMFKLY